MPPAIIGGAIAGVGAIGGAVIGAGAASSAAKSAARTAAANNALQREQYQANTANIQPFMDRGNDAGERINALLGLPSGEPVDWESYVREQPDLLKDWQTYASGTGDYRDIGEYGKYHFDRYGGGEHRNLTPYQNDTVNSGQSPTDILRETPGYQFRFDEGMNALNTGYAAGGKLRSGAAQRASIRYGQDYGSNEFGKQMGYLSNQQAVGLTGANALAGVGTNYANSVSANNTNAAATSANAGLAGASMFGNALAGGARGIGQALGSSYNRPTPQLPYDMSGF